MTPAETGKIGELAVGYYLEALHYTILDRNFRIPGGEIDLVAVKDDELCFVEVKTRSLDSMTSGAEAVDRRKQRLLIRASYTYCEKRNLNEEDWYIRYDIAEVTMWRNRLINIDYLENAFDETDFHENI